MAIHDELEALERQGWQALASGGTVAGTFYERVLGPKVVMLLPGGLVLTDRDAIIRSMSGPPWESYELRDLAVLDVTSDSALVYYGARAVRASGPEYSALISTLYVRAGGAWKLVSHQQTPC